MNKLVGTLGASLLLVCATVALSTPPLAPSPLIQPADPIAYFRTLQQARALMAQQDFAAAEPLLERLAREYPLDRLNWSMLATARRNLGRCREAIPAYQRAIDLIGPTPSAARYWIAACHAQLGDRDAALATLEQYVVEDRAVDRPQLFGDSQFAAFRNDPRLLRITGRAEGGRPDRGTGLRGDLDYLLSEIRRLSPHYRNGGDIPEATMAAARALRAAIPSLSDEQVYARMAEVVGTLDANHTLFRSFPQPGRERFERFLPVTFYAFPEGLFVVRAEPEARALIGQRLVAIDSVPADEAFRRIIQAHSAGAASELYWTAPQRLSESRLLHGLGIARSSTRVTLTLADARGRASRHVLNAGAADNFGKLGPPPGIAPPLFLSRPDEAHWLQAWPDMSSIYVQVNQIADDPDETMAQFGIRLRRALAERPARNLVLDLRRNNGGNTFTYVELLRTLIAFSAQEGNRLYVILGRTTYSAAANLATDLERLASPVFLGEPSGDFGNQEGDEGQIILPYSQWSASVGAVWWQVSHPWDRRRFIAPQVPVQLTAQAYFAGQDPALEAVRALIRMN